METTHQTLHWAASSDLSPRCSSAQALLLTGAAGDGGAAAAAVAGENGGLARKAVAKGRGRQARCVHVDKGLSVFVWGHLYCRGTRSFAIGVNLARVAEVYRERGSIEAVRREIGGGVFACAVVDRERQIAYAFTDRLGAFPLYRKGEGQRIVISADESVLRGQSEVSLSATLEYLRYGYLPFSDSLYEGVQRIGPGEVVTIRWKSGLKVDSSGIELPCYPKPSDQIHDIESAAGLLIDALDGYFARVGSESYAAGLSGGYDSRLIAAYLAETGPGLVTMGAEGSHEIDLARRVAARLGLETTVRENRPMAPRLHAERFRGAMQSLDSLEGAHVFELISVLEGTGADYYVDGYIGDVVLGGHYYYKLAGGPEPIARVLLLRDRYCEPVRTTDAYVDMVGGARGRAVRDSVLNELGREVRDERVARQRELIEEQRECCHSHADMIELLWYRMRGWRLIAGGPVSFMSSRPALCPFADDDVSGICRTVSKHLRAGDRLHRALSIRRFPGLVDIPKVDTGGCARDGERLYRLRHLRRAVVRRARQAAVERLRGGKRSISMGFESPPIYCAEAENQRFMESVVEGGAQALDAAIRKPLVNAFREGRMSPELRLRLVSLILLLTDEARGVVGRIGGMSR